MGAGMAVVRPGEAPQFECIGVADRSNRVVAPETVFRIASISKTMTAIGVLQLRDAGHVDLDEPVNRYLKAFTVDPPAGAPAVTLRHLLTHTSGIGELPSVSDLVRREVWGMGAPRAAPAALGSIYGGTLHTEVPVGSKWAYANHAFAVLGQVVEDVAGVTRPESCTGQHTRPPPPASADGARTTHNPTDLQPLLT
jgi:CubicO group peptidase (beta-lactamase class C family)